MPGSMLPVTLAAAAAAALVNLWLAIRIGRLRRAEKIFVGDGGHPLLAARMRAQANFVEYAPITLILLGLTEAARGTNGWLWSAAVIFILGRITHGLGMEGWRAARMGGILSTFAVMLGLAVYALVILMTSGTPDIAIDLPPTTV